MHGRPTERHSSPHPALFGQGILFWTPLLNGGIIVTMNMEHEFQAPKKELDLPGSLNVSPKMLKALAKMTRGEPLTWGATPLEPHRRDVATQQRAVQRNIRNRFPQTPEKVPYDLDWATALYIQDNYEMRTARRVSKNYDSYQNRGNFDLSAVPLEALSMLDRSLSGHAAPAELMLTSRLEEIATIELASDSHLYGEGITDLTPMRQATEEGILFFGGNVSNKAPVYEVRHASYFNSEYRNAVPSLLMTRTVEVGELSDDEKTYERSSFNAILPRMVPKLMGQIKDIKYDQEWSSKILKLPGFEDAVFSSLDDDRYDVAVPVSTTSVLVNARLEKELLHNKKHTEARQREIAKRALMDNGRFTILI